MPYSDKQKRKEYSKKRAQEALLRRREFLIDKFCETCGATENLEIDHVDWKTKTSHNFWSWSEVKRNEELKKCQTLCRDCHRKKTSLEWKLRPQEKLRKLSKDQVIEIWNLHFSEKKSQKDLSKEFKVSRATICGILYRRYYREITKTLC